MDDSTALVSQNLVCKRVLGLRFEGLRVEGLGFRLLRFEGLGLRV